MIRVTYEPREHRLRVEGHALAAPAGEDLVCAAASALAWTLVRAAIKRSEYRPRLFIDRERAAGSFDRKALAPTEVMAKRMNAQYWALYKTGPFCLPERKVDGSDWEGGEQ